MAVKLPALLGNFDRQTNQPTKRQTHRPGHREVSLQKILIKYNLDCDKTKFKNKVIWQHIRIIIILYWRSSPPSPAVKWSSYPS